MEDLIHILDVFWAFLFVNVIIIIRSVENSWNLHRDYSYIHILGCKMGGD
jgi:hypothetical protein